MDAPHHRWEKRRPSRRSAGRGAALTSLAALLAWGAASPLTGDPPQGGGPPAGRAQPPARPLDPRLQVVQQGGAIILDERGVQTIVLPQDFRPEVLLFDDPAMGFPFAIDSGSLPSDERLAAVAIEPSVRELVANLESPDWKVREAATEALAVDLLIDEQLLALLAGGGERAALGPEARHRLLGIVCDRLATLPRAALGIRMDQRAIGPGVVIEGLIEDMPAKQSGQLQAGDRIMAIDGRPIIRSGASGSIFQLERPGQRVRLTVDRPRPVPAGAQPPEELQELRRAAGLATQPTEFDRFEMELVLGSADQLERNELQGWGGARSASIRLRTEQVREAIGRFGPPTLEIPVARLPSDDELPIEDHPELRELLLIRERVEAGEFIATPSLRAAWRQTLESLRAQAADATLPEASRDYLRRVAARYAEVMPGK